MTNRPGAGEPAAPDVTTRVLNADAGGALKRFQDASLIAGGRLHLLSVDAIAEAYGSRWSLQSSRVEKYLQHVLLRELGDEAQFVALSPTDTLVLSPPCDTDSARVACVRYLRQVLHHFLGTSSRALDGVYDIVAVKADRVEARRINRAVLAALESAADLKAERAEALARATEPFVASHGRKVRVACELDALLTLKSGAAIGLRMTPKVRNQKDDSQVAPSDLSMFAGVDRQRVDWSTIVHGLAQLRERGGPVPAVIAPMSYASLSSQRGRTEMLDLLRDMREHSAHGVICEVSGVEGAPYAQLQEAVSIIRPLSLFLVGKIDAPSQVVWSHLKGAGLRGIAFDCPSAEGTAELLGSISSLVKKARRVAPSVLVYGLPSIELAEPLRNAGATHATLVA